MSYLLDYDKTQKPIELVEDMNDMTTFRKNLFIMTNGCLELIDWSKIIIAGNLVHTCLKYKFGIIKDAQQYKNENQIKLELFLINITNKDLTIVISYLLDILQCTQADICVINDLYYKISSLNLDIYICRTNFQSIKQIIDDPYYTEYYCSVAFDGKKIHKSNRLHSDKKLIYTDQIWRAKQCYYNTTDILQFKDIADEKLQGEQHDPYQGGATMRQKTELIDKNNPISNVINILQICNTQPRNNLDVSLSNLVEAHSLVIKQLDQYKDKIESVNKYELVAYNEKNLDLSTFYVQDDIISYVINESLDNLASPDVQKRLKFVIYDRNNRSVYELAVIYNNDSLYHLGLQDTNINLNDVVNKNKQNIYHSMIKYNSHYLLDNVLLDNILNKQKLLQGTDIYNLTPVHYAVIYDNLNFVKQINSNQLKTIDKLIDICFTFKRYDIAKYLISIGYDKGEHMIYNIIQNQNKDIDMLNIIMPVYKKYINNIINNDTPLCYIIDNFNDDKCVEIAKILLRNGSELHTTLKFRQPLLLAVKYGYVVFTSLMIDNQVDINCLNEDAQTPLDIVEHKLIQITNEDNYLNSVILGKQKENNAFLSRKQNFYDYETTRYINVNQNNKEIKIIQTKLKELKQLKHKFDEIKNLLKNGKHITDIDVKSLSLKEKKWILSRINNCHSNNTYKPEYTPLIPELKFYDLNNIEYDYKLGLEEFNNVWNGKEPKLEIYSSISKITPFHLAVLKNHTIVLKLPKKILELDTEYGDIYSILCKINSPELYNLNSYPLNVYYYYASKEDFDVLNMLIRKTNYIFTEEQLRELALKSPKSLLYCVSYLKLEIDDTIVETIVKNNLVPHFLVLLKISPQSVKPYLIEHADKDILKLMYENNFKVSNSTKLLNFECVKLALHYQKSLINYKTDDGVPWLNYAIQQNQQDIAMLLIHKKVDQTIQDNNGNTALHIAVQTNYMYDLELHNIENHSLQTPYDIMCDTMINLGSNIWFGKLNNNNRIPYC